MPQETTRPEVLEIQRAGYRAYLSGQSPKENPYNPESEENIQRQKAWFRGYAASKTDRARTGKQAPQGPRTGYRDDPATKRHTGP